MHPVYLFIFLVRRLHSKYCKALLSMSLFSKWLCNWLNNNFWKVFCCTQHAWWWQTVPIYDYCALQVVVFLCGLRFFLHKKINTASKVFLVVTCGCLGPAVKTTNTRVVSWPSTGSYWAASSALGWWCPPRRAPVPQCLPRPSLPSAPAGSSVWPSTSWSRGTWATACEGRDPPNRRCHQGKDAMCLVEREIQDSKVVFQCGTCQEKISEVIAVNLLNLELQEMLLWISILSVFHQDQSGTQQGTTGTIRVQASFWFVWVSHQ